MPLSPETEPAQDATGDFQARRRGHWRATRRLTLWLMTVWVVASFGLIWFARDLSFQIMGWPFGFWVAAQGAPLLFCVIVAVYSVRMRRLDRQFGVSDPPEKP